MSLTHPVRKPSKTLSFSVDEQFPDTFWTSTLISASTSFSESHSPDPKVNIFLVAVNTTYKICPSRPWWAQTPENIYCGKVYCQDTKKVVGEGGGSVAGKSFLTTWIFLPDAARGIKNARFRALYLEITFIKDLSLEIYTMLTLTKWWEHAALVGKH